MGASEIVDQQVNFLSIQTLPVDSLFLFFYMISQHCLTQ